MKMKLTLWLYLLICSLEGILNWIRGGESRLSATSLEYFFHKGFSKLRVTGDEMTVIVYAMTMGEMSVMTPIIKSYRQNWPNDKLIVLTAQSQYFDAIHAAYPDAAVGLPTWRAPWLLDLLFNMSKPRIAIISEAPTLHCYTPIRLGLPLTAACLHHKVPLFIPNASYHKLEISCRLDWVEHFFFSDIHKHAVTRWYTTSEKARQELEDISVPTDRIDITGELRFDSLSTLGESKNPELLKILNIYSANGGPVIVAGSVNNQQELTSVIKAWQKSKNSMPGAKLIIAPRYVNDADTMSFLCDYLSENGIRYQKRSKGLDGIAEIDVLVVDVFGELSHFYSIATVSYIGRNHGILEPLRYECPIVVGSDWRTDFVTYDLYRILIDAGGGVLAGNDDDLGSIFVKLITDKTFHEKTVEHAMSLLNQHRGATDKIMKSIKIILDD